MKSKKELESKINTFLDRDKETIRFCTEKLKNLLESDTITEENIQTIEAIITDLTNIRKSHTDLIVRWLKQGYVLD